MKINKFIETNHLRECERERVCKEKANIIRNSLMIFFGLSRSLIIYIFCGVIFGIQNLTNGQNRV
jgi:hypothetical protein